MRYINVNHDIYKLKLNWCYIVAFTLNCNNSNYLLITSRLINQLGSYSMLIDTVSIPMKSNFPSIRKKVY